MDAADLLASLRLRLDDVPAVDDDPRWSDDELMLYLRDAVKVYSRDFPRERRQQFVADGTSSEFDLPVDLIDDFVTAVFQEGSRGQQRVANIFLRGRLARFWQTQAGKLMFSWTPAAGTAFVVVYDALHELPEMGDMTVPSEDEDLIFTYAMMLAWKRVGGNDAALSRWKESGKRDDSPLIPQYVFLRREYEELVRQRKNRPRAVRLTRAEGSRGRGRRPLGY